MTQPAASDVTPDAAGPHIDGGDVRTGVGSAPKRAGVSVEASWHVECSACGGGMITASSDRTTSLADAAEHADEHRKKGDIARLFTGCGAFDNAEKWTQKSPPHSRREARE